MNFDEYRQNSKILVLHYADMLNCDIAETVVSGKADIKNKKEAIELAYFFWEMTDEAVDDEHNDREIEGIVDLQFCLEKALHIFRGYFKATGFESEWTEGYELYHRHEKK